MKSDERQSQLSAMQLSVIFSVLLSAAVTAVCGAVSAGCLWKRTTYRVDEKL